LTLGCKNGTLRTVPGADSIATFVEVVRRGSLSAAARSLGLPKSTVSRRLQRLEQELHTRLLDRDARRVTLTAAGRGFYESVVKAVDALDAAVASLERSSQEPRGRVRLTAPSDLGRMVLARMLVAFLERYPEIELDLVFTNRLVDLAQEGVDLAVRAGRLPRGDLIARKLCDSELQLAASPTGASTIDESAGIQRLEQRAFVLHQAEGPQQTLRLECGSSKSGKTVELKVSGRLNVDDYAALAELVSAGEGIGLLPAVHVQEGLRTGRLVRLFSDWATRSSHVYLVSAARQQPARVRLLSRFLIDAFAALGRV
jgi:DNA-binding transcriptional LysR family regulator